MACTSENGMGQSCVKHESLQALASKLPQGNTLPDGFSECFPETSGNSSSVGFSENSASLAAESTVAFNESTGVMGMSIDGFDSSAILSGKCSDLCSASKEIKDSPAEGQRFSSSTSDLSVEFNDGSLCSPSLDKRVERRQKIRRFPVQLFEKETLDSVNDGNASAIEGADQKGSNDIVAEREFPDYVLDPCCDANASLSPKLQAASLSEENVLNPLESRLGSEKSAPLGLSTMESTEEITTRARKQDLEDQDAMLEQAEQCFSNEVHLIESDVSDQVNIRRSNEGVDVILLENEMLDLRLKYDQVIKEKDSTVADLDRSIVIQKKLESLCRELQRQNNQLKDECKQIAFEEQQKRLDLSTRFHSTIKDVSSKLEEQGDERLRQIKENEMLREKVKHFTQQYELREQQYGQQLRAKSLEIQLIEVKLKQQEELLKQEETKTRLYTQQIAQLLATEKDLRAQLALYVDKFEQFQETLTKSNEVFTSFKKEMEKMSKTIRKVEKENLDLKKKCEKSDITLIELFDERGILKKQLETTKNQKEKLEALCRSLQAERKQQNLTTASAVASAAAVGAAASVAATLNSDQMRQKQ